MSDSLKFSKSAKLPGKLSAKFVVAGTHPFPSAIPADRKQLHALRAIVLLAGAVRPSPFVSAVGRALLDLPLAEARTMLDQWRWHALRLAGVLDVDRVPTRILVNETVPAPSLAAGDAEMGLTIEKDCFELRGTGGVLRDICSAYDDDDVLLVATAAQVLTESLFDVASAMRASGGDLCLMANGNGTPSSLMLVRCRCLRTLPDSGFIDMKEQAIPMIAVRHRVTVVRHRTAVGIPVRSHSEYARAVRMHDRLLRGESAADDPFREQWESACSVVESGASVETGARLHDSIVLRGGRVERNAVLVRSVVCGGAVVRAGATIVDQLVVKTK